MKVCWFYSRIKNKAAALFSPLPFPVTHTICGRVFGTAIAVASVIYGGGCSW